MSAASTVEAAACRSNPPEAPPLPPQKPPREKVTFALKARTGPPGWAYFSKNELPSRDLLSPPPGTYFLYGTLRDPAMLMGILDLPGPPVLRPAYVVGYTRRLWGQYPALVDGPPGAIVHGSAFDVPTAVAAEKLAYYETRNYAIDPCLIHVDDGERSSSDVVDGYTFVFAGRPNDLRDGEFDLDLWLKSVGRAESGEVETIPVAISADGK